MKTAEEIERIVREVILRLTLAQTRELSATSATAGTLTLNERVISLGAIEGRLTGITQLIVPANAVITPSVRDELRSKKVRLVKQNASRRTASGTHRKLLIANLGNKNINQSINALPCETKTIQQGSLENAVAEMTAQLTNNTLGLIISDQPELAVCLANRNSHVRAFVGHGIASVRRSKTFEGNLMAVDSSTSLSTSFLKDFVGE